VNRDVLTVTGNLKILIQPFAVIVERILGTTFVQVTLKSTRGGIPMI